MKLAQPFYRLPLAVDAARLATEVAQFAEAEWQRHPSGYSGNSAIRLISVGGGENDGFAGAMLPTPALLRCPYIAQLLASLGVVWSRSRLMRLAPGASVPVHCDLNYHWVNRVRLHIPVRTQPTVQFICGGVSVHMAAGEVWTFDNWRAHEVHNRSAEERIHLVADTAGSAAFWAMVKSHPDFRTPPAVCRQLAYAPGIKALPHCERHNVSTVMPPAEVAQLLGDLLGDLQPPEATALAAAASRYVELGEALAQDWRTLWSLYADTRDGWPHYARLRDQARAELLGLPAGLLLASNSANAVEVFDARILSYLVHLPAEAGSAPPRTELDRTLASSPGTRRLARLERPLFIVAAPRSGSTLLFETLAQARNLFTLGGEAHGLIESLPQLRPEAEGVGSNRLTAAHASDAIRQHMLEALGTSLRDRQGQPYAGGSVRWLEKTPKNALRLPFFKALFPDARFVHLWRTPEENLASIIEAWSAGGWVTYPQLEGWDGPWSLLLPPGWQALRGKAMEQIAAFQWQRTNSILLDDLAALPRSDWMRLSYAELLANPAAAVQKICAFADVEFDAGLAAHLARPLPLARHTLAAPAAGKWRKHEAAIARVLPDLQGLLARLQVPRDAVGSP